MKRHQKAERQLNIQDSLTNASDHSPQQQSEIFLNTLDQWHGFFQCFHDGFSGSIGTRNSFATVVSNCDKSNSRNPSVFLLGNQQPFLIKPNIHLWKRLTIPRISHINNQHVVVSGQDNIPFAHIPVKNKHIKLLHQYLASRQPLGVSPIQSIKPSPLQPTHHFGRLIFKYRIHTCRIQSLLEETISRSIPVQITLQHDASEHSNCVYLNKTVLCGKWLHLLSPDGLVHIRHRQVIRASIEQYTSKSLLILKGSHSNDQVSISVPKMWRAEWEKLLATFEPINLYTRSGN